MRKNTGQTKLKDHKIEKKTQLHRNLNSKWELKSQKFSGCDWQK